MIRSKQAYLQQLTTELQNIDLTDLIQEIDSHISEMLFDLEAEGLNEEEAMQIVIQNLGAPKQVAAMYKKEANITPKKTQNIFIIVNLVMFLSGVFITLFYHLLDSSMIHRIWNLLISIPSLIIFCYMLFWVILGYEIGKEFGKKGTRLLVRTFILTLIPNVTLMFFVVFRLIPLDWFGHLLTQSFINLCIVCTILLYPISYAGFRWGTKNSI